MILMVWFFYNGYYHIFYQHSPDYEVPGKQPMHWGHAITKDFLTYEELSPALYPDKDYDCNGCWSGNAIVKDDTLYLFYASIDGENNQRVSMAYSKDGINFEKCPDNPVIYTYPKDGGPDFRDPAIAYVNGVYYCVMASGNSELKMARLLLYKSENLINWEYVGVMSEWQNSVYAECPSFVRADDKYLLATSVQPIETNHYFSIMYGDFQDNKYTPTNFGNVNVGPDQYAGQIFGDHKGRNILISWIPGWKYAGYASKDVGCMSIPRQIFLKNGKIYAYPVEEVQHLLKDSDPAVEINENGFVIKRMGRENVVCNNKIDDIKILRDEYILEVFVNGGEEVYSVLL